MYKYEYVYLEFVCIRSRKMLFFRDFDQLLITCRGYGRYECQGSPENYSKWKTNDVWEKIYRKNKDIMNAAKLIKNLKTTQVAEVLHTQLKYGDVKTMLCGPNKECKSTSRKRISDVY